MLQQNLIADLQRIYSLFSRVKGGHSLLRERLSTFVMRCGTDIVTSDENRRVPSRYVSALVDLKSQLDSFNTDAFSSDKQTAAAISQCFERFMNSNPQPNTTTLSQSDSSVAADDCSIRSAEYLSLYVDELLRKGLAGRPEDESEKKLDEVMTLFRYLQVCVRESVYLCV